MMHRKLLLGSTIIAGVAALSVAPAFAQTANTQPNVATPPTPAVQAPGTPTGTANVGTGEEVEELVVTGSRIRRDATNAPAPLIQLGRTEIIESGQPNLVDYLADVPALSGSTVPEDTTGSNLNDGGLSLLNLRNLGASRTLVLVDGRRHVGSVPNGLSVDVDTIPSLLIENVEIVTGGQSALYGADAVSGVVNFILRKDFEGLEIDGSASEINQDGQMNYRISGLVGHNFLDDRLNVYAFGEYQKSDEVLDLDMDWRRKAYTLLNNDTDVNVATPDGQLDNILISGARDAYFARGGLLVLSGGARPSATTDPDIPNQACTGGTGFPGNGGTFSANCFPVAPELGKTYVFNADGSFRPFNFGTFQDQNGFSRRVNVGGDGLNTGTEFGQGSRLPESEAMRFQTGLNFAVTDYLSVFAEAKYVKEETYDSGQPSFFQLNVGAVAPNTVPTLLGSSVFNIGLDNAYLPTALRTLIQNNTRQTFAAGTAGAPGAVTGTVSDPRAQMNLFGPSRFQENTRELQRYVAGVRGDFTSFGFIKNISYEAAYTYGEVDNENIEAALDVERWQLAIDAVRNSAGAIVCRAQELASRGVAVPNQNLGGNYAANDPIISGCTPINIFGSDFRSDANEDNITGGGGRPGLTAAQAQYILAAVTVKDNNKQHDFNAFTSGEFGDFWGAGPIGVAVGYEYRKEITSSVGRDVTTGDRFLFLNTGASFPETSYSVNEGYAELRIPLLKDLPFAESAEISGAYRYSSYDGVFDGDTETYSVQAQWRPTRDILFRATYGKSVRIPFIGDLADPGGQTFANGLTDPCDFNALRNVTDATIRANRRANCVALLGAGYNPDATAITYPSGVPGTFGGNPNLAPEESRSYTGSVVLTPRFIPNLSMVFDFYDISITNAIAAPSIQAILNACVSGNVINTGACSVLTRNGNLGATDPASFRLVDFLQASLNYAATDAKGIDFSLSYRFNTEDVIGRNWGSFAYTIRGNYLIRQEDFINIQDPGDASEFDSTQGLPRVRFLSRFTYSPMSSLRFTWDWDWQASQEIVDSDTLINDPDNRLAQYLETGAFSQHDFTVAYDLRNALTIRAGIVNAFDEEPARWLGSTTTSDNFDLFGRRFFVGFNYKFGQR